MEEMIAWWGLVFAAVMAAACFADWRKGRFTWRAARDNVIGALGAVALLYVATDGGRELQRTPPPICDEQGHCDR